MKIGETRRKIRKFGHVKFEGPLTYPHIHIQEATELEFNRSKMKIKI
jgi:hypothetical protein